VQRLQTELVPQEELDRAVKQQRAMLAYGNENITNQAFWMGFSEIYASYEDWYMNFIHNLNTVTPQEIRRVARQWLNTDQRVIGKYIPDHTPAGEDNDEHDD